MTVTLVTGATGQDGSFLVERLLQRGDEVHALVRQDLVGGETTPPTGVTIHGGELADLSGLAELMDRIEPDAVFHLAGISSVAQSWLSPAETGLVSGVGAVALMEAALRLQVRRSRPTRFVQASSAEIFGVAAEVPQRESTPLNPVSPYGAAKAYAHTMAGLFRTRGLPVSCAILYGHESPRRPASFVTRKITRGAARIARGLDAELTLGNLEARRDWGWAPDYVDAMLRMTEVDAQDFIVATGSSHSVGDFAAAAFAAVGIDDWRAFVRVDPAFLRPGEAAEQIGDATRARTILGWAPSRQFGEIVSAMVEFDLAEIDRESDTGSLER